MTFQIRPTTDKDLQDIGNIAEKTGLFPREALADMIAGYLRDAGPDIWLTAERGGAAIGFCFCESERFTNGSWNLLAIGVLPELQKQGVGRRLLAHLESLLTKAGHRVLIVDTIGTSEFSRTHAFYLATGFVSEARIRDFWDDGADKLTFWKHLRAATR
ncbi:MAG: GNAT family N-acetyltransferase [Beijerinckiaceae bacterium]|nr:GNAT family N-acetyltransferase [Beijerinckiaceae bacterium]